MIHPFITMQDETEVAFSEIITKDGEETLTVYFEKPVETGFISAECIIPSYHWNINGFNEQEITVLENFVRLNRGCFFTLAKREKQGYSEDIRSYFNALDKILSKRYPQYGYSLGCYQEWCNCLQPEEDGWVVYLGERGNQNFEVKCDTILYACLELFRKFTHNTDEVSVMENELISILGKGSDD